MKKKLFNISFVLFLICMFINISSSDNENLNECSFFERFKFFCNNFFNPFDADKFTITINEKKKKLDTLTEKIKNLETELNESNNKYSTLKSLWDKWFPADKNLKSIEQKFQEIFDLHEKLVELKTKIDRFEEEFNNNYKEKLELEHEFNQKLTALNNKIESQKNTLNIKEKSIEEIKKQITNQDQKLRENNLITHELSKLSLEDLKLLANCIKYKKYIIGAVITMSALFVSAFGMNIYTLSSKKNIKNY